MPHFGRQHEGESLNDAISDRNLEGPIGAAGGTLLGAGLGYGVGKAREYFNEDEGSWTDIFTEGPSALVNEKTTPEQMAVWGGSLGMPIGKELGQTWERQNEQQDREEARRRRRMMRMRRMIAQQQQDAGNEPSATKEGSLTRKKEASFAAGFAQRLNEEGISPEQFTKFAADSNREDLIQIARMIQTHVQ